MPSTLPFWILKNSARSGIATLQGGKRLYSRWASNGNEASWRLFSHLPNTRKSSVPCSGFTLQKAFRHTSTEEDDFQLQLSPQQVNEVLRAGESAHKILDLVSGVPNSVLRFESNQLAANSPVEDRRGIATCLQTNGLMFGIFDGHGGHACAQAVSERLFYYVAVSLMSQQTLERMEGAVESMKPLLPILHWLKRPGDSIYKDVTSVHLDHLRVYWQELLDLHMEMGLNIKEALTHSFQRLDSDISLEVQAPLEDEMTRNLSLQVAFSGATACMAHVDGVHLHVANAGDCRAILGVQEDNGMWSCLPLTCDHNAWNPAELSRLKREHPISEDRTVIVDHRLLGVLMPCRAFGDVQLKWSKELQHSVLERGCDTEALNIYQFTPPHYYTPPYLTAKPEVTYHRLRPQDKFLVLASDGLWDVLGNEEVVRLVVEHLAEAGRHKPDLAQRPANLGLMQSLLLQRKAQGLHAADQNAATRLIRHAIGTNEYGEMEPERLTAMLTLPEDLARMYRDDITVTVVYFNSDSIDTYYRGG
ncbi:pyruvate dehydrogenase [acetyl-transferring]-phosphatase 2, mitochondrial [Lutra lutra]|uniref:pyruvate dehydrogenase [acetyl-transferring]-phosphatase 2, mitochondrial n=1 Tax=Lutra lutra TaxID=9657 RepID=UPI001FD14137|nr:pyruvate dehydrogenase [acetyl-transferring]-phosphatase 2, mitochondrial [Lutra lutra]XP_047566366.1 pyruvate dehydrogenase [acetyl-transferring]-phosphatase 2, mitochondrial [Lutra lutra]XP_047566367.1 pyruvate dehydrogenase [acetyl-transferring]-phosphatase 2, mitochondrial [Lutra lutra]XP_047566368.1 pyruvate dehydrogenase [acetyl-transferring]-phosphatase 2, mitochondrial [Lutra lutra]XP_047566369.1 pyruvate dehydrogenase [acetyl-transferring]-phosphatase 2, mitochondrial [Lutra lutra]